MDAFQKEKLANSQKAVGYIFLLFREIRTVCKQFSKERSKFTVRTLELFQSLVEDGVLRVLMKVADNHADRKKLYEACPVEQLLAMMLADLQREEEQM